MIQTGDIAIVRRHFKPLEPGSYSSVGVRFFTGCRWNHSFPLIVLEGRVFVSEAVGSGVSGLVPLELWSKRYDHDMKIIRLSVQFNSVEDKQERLLSVIGRPYDYKSLLWHQPKRQLRRMLNQERWWDGLTDKSGADGHLYCSEHAMYVNNYPEWWRYTTAGILEEPYELVTPLAALHPSTSSG